MAYDELEEAHIFLFLFPKLRGEEPNVPSSSNAVSRSILPHTGCAFVSSDAYRISHGIIDRHCRGAHRSCVNASAGSSGFGSVQPELGIEIPVAPFQSPAEMRARGSPPRSDGTDDLAAFNALAEHYVDATQVEILRQESLPVIDDDHGPLEVEVIVRETHDSFRWRSYRRSGWSGEIHTVVRALLDAVQDALRAEGARSPPDHGPSEALAKGREIRARAIAFLLSRRRSLDSCEIFFRIAIDLRGRKPVDA
jgi:hypothetical protein